MATSDDEAQDPGHSDPENPDSDPIVVIKGGGAYVRLPMPEAVAKRLGGSSRLHERLSPILDAGPQLASGISSHDAIKLTTQYDELFNHLELVAAEWSPIHVTKKGGSAITVIIPEAVVTRLGGSSRLHERLSPILDAGPRLASGISLHDAVKLTTQYGELFDQYEEIMTEQGQ